MISERFSYIDDIEVYENIDLKKYSTSKLTASGNVIMAKSRDALKKVIEISHEHNYRYIPLGWAANQVLTGRCDFYLKYAVNFNRSYLKVARNEYTLPASLSLNVLVSTAKELGLKGWEVLAGIPASLGGAIAMNAGTKYGDISQIVASVDTIKSNGEICHYSEDQLKFGYRSNKFLEDGEFIFQATLKTSSLDMTLKDSINNYLEDRKKTQPISSFNCGCVFKNNDDFKAGMIIDKLGLSGLVSENIRISHVHSNFFENIGAANAEHFESFIKQVRSYIEDQCASKFEFEVKLN